MTAATSFAVLWNNYPAPQEFNHGELFDYLGWKDIKNNPAYENTCAIRMSLCLIRSGITIPGRIKIHASSHKGKLIEPGQVKLSNILTRPELFGPPKKFKLDKRDEVLKDKQGIISFMRIPGYSIDGALSGHIDLVKHGKFLFFWDALKCAESCYWNSAEFWFWPVR